jgi:protein TonB
MSDLAADAGPNAKRKRTLPAVRLPEPKEKRAGSAAVSLLLHALLIFLLMVEMAPDPPPFDGIDLTNMQPMGNGIAGGGGGGRRGTGGSVEYIKFVQPPRPQVQETLKPVEIKPPEPVVVPLPPVPDPPKPDPVVEPPKPVAVVEPPKPVAVASVTAGTGGGSGNDGSRGMGPGSGGGIGSGIGTGIGSGVGPGTGGGRGLPDTLMIYPPSPIELIMPPLPSPTGLKGCAVLADLEIDVDGKVLGVTRSDKCRRDKNYDKRLEDLLKGTRFRPAVRVDGSPVKVKFRLTLEF